jgi:hypothetical protein
MDRQHVGAHNNLKVLIHHVLARISGNPVPPEVLEQIWDKVRHQSAGAKKRDRPRKTQSRTTKRKRKQAKHATITSPLLPANVSQAAVQATEQTTGVLQALVAAFALFMVWTIAWTMGKAYKLGSLFLAKTVGPSHNKRRKRRKQVAPRRKPPHSTLRDGSSGVTKAVTKAVRKRRYKSWLSLATGRPPG